MYKTVLVSLSDKSGAWYMYNTVLLSLRSGT